MISSCAERLLKRQKYIFLSLVRCIRTRFDHDFRDLLRGITFGHERGHAWNNIFLYACASSARRITIPRIVTQERIHHCGENIYLN